MERAQRMKEREQTRITTTSKKSRKELSPAWGHAGDLISEGWGDTRIAACRGAAATTPTPAENAGIFALLDVSPVVEADFHPAAVRLVVKRDLGTGGDRGGLLVGPAAPRAHPQPPRRALTVMVKV